jgi:UDP-N-acetyl-D-glucosamine dehydrogenase
MDRMISVIGLGFVGLPLALTFVNSGYQVVGVDVDNRKLKYLSDGRSYLPDISDEDVSKAVATKRFTLHSDYSCIQHSDTVILCVPTPLTKDHHPDLTYLINAAEGIYPYLRKGHLVILESSTYPGTTREVLQPLLEKGGLKVGQDLYLAYSPERIDPGNEQYSLDAIPKVVSGITNHCLNAVSTIYSDVFQVVVPVTTVEVAEMTKLLENSYRFVNISFINELATVCDSLRIDIWEVISAAQTKPYGFSAFYPGPGIGGHCIPIDPIYLQWKMRMHGHNSVFIESSHEQNDKMSKYVVESMRKLLDVQDLAHARILMIGVTYKRDVNDIRESSAIEILRMLLKEGADVAFYDPYVPTITVNGLELQSVELEVELLRKSSCVIIATDHSNLPLEHILTHAPLIYDTRNVTRGMNSKAKVVRLGAGEINK